MTYTRAYFISGISSVIWRPLSVFVACALTAGQILAQTTAPLNGIVSNSAGEPIEGVVVIAEPQGQNWKIAVSSDATGHYAFRADRLPPGRYAITARATGYQLKEAVNVTVTDQSTQRDLSLSALTDKDQLASQLTSLEWLRSWPADTQIKDAFTHNLVNCMFCHSLERIARSNYSAQEFLPVIQRMLTYETDHSSGERIQRVAPPAPLEDLSWFGTPASDIAEFLANVNLSEERKHWPYDFELLPRPTGDATKAVVTVFTIPRANSVIHDLDVDSQGRVWYGNTGWDYLGMLDPASGQFSEWPAPNFLPTEVPENVDRIVGVQDIQVDPQGHVWVAAGGTKLTRFMPEKEKWQAFDLPVIWRNPFLSPIREGEAAIWATGLAGLPDGHKRHETAYRLDIKTGQLSPGITLFDHMPPPDDPWHDDPLNYCYMMDQDQDGNFLCTASVPSGIIRGNRETGESVFYPTPTRHAYPRRGYRDNQNRFWFSEFYADNIGVMDLNTNHIKEFAVGPQYISPYYARPDNRGYIWSSALGSDRLLRLDPSSGDVVSYLMPVYYDARKVVVDESSAHTVVWLPNKNSAELIRVELFND